LPKPAGAAVPLLCGCNSLDAQPYITETFGGQTNITLANMTLNTSNANSDFVLPEQYGLPKVSAQQKLTPLDMNLPRVYGSRWILCFALPTGAGHAQMYI
jgi:hypothetical protein